MEANPISILFVKSDCKGDRLLFRYPYNLDTGQLTTVSSHRRSPYSLPPSCLEDFYSTTPQTSKLHKNILTSLSDEALSTLFAVKADFVDKKFELKINDMRFVGHPTLIHSESPEKFNGTSNVVLINILFALHASARPSIVKCYYDLSKRLGKAFKHEEDKTSYVTKEIIALLSAHDMVSPSTEQGNKMDTAAYEIILKKSEIAQNIKKVYDELTTSGLVYIKINRNHQLSFCLPQKVHKFYCKGIMVEPELIDKCIKHLKPYHGLLLLTEPNRLLDSLYPHSSTPLIRLIKMYSPLKSIQTLSTDTSLPPNEISSMIGSLVYWGKATVIYPLCASNVYVIAPESSTHTNSSLVEKFMQAFPGRSLLQEISEFSLPISLKHRISPLSYPHEQREIAQMVVWMLQHRLLTQLHTYLFFAPASSNSVNKLKRKSNEDEVESATDHPLISTPLKLDSEVNVWPKLITLAAHEKIGDEILALESELKPIFSKISSKVLQDDLKVFLKFYKQGYLRGVHHIEEIMFLDNRTRADICQLIDKLRHVIITCDIEDPHVSLFYPHTQHSTFN